VVGFGAATAIGQTAPATAAAARAGVAGFGEHPFLIDRKTHPYVLAMAPYLDRYLPLPERLLGLALSAAREALASVAGRMPAQQAIPAFVGLPSPRPGLPEGLGPILTRQLAATTTTPGIRLTPIELLARGHSAGLMAMEAACQAVRGQQSAFCLAGGVDGYIDPDTLDWLDANDQIHNPDNAWGFIPGEAAAFCVLCSERTAEQWGLQVQCRLVAAATDNEPNRIKTETVCLGRGLTQVFQKVLSSLPAGERVAHTICDQNGEAYRADEYGFSLTRTHKHFVDGTNFMAPADCWGDVGAASGPLFALMAAWAAQKGYAPGPWTLAWTSSEGGERCAALIQAEVT
jgi:3-oxoacyl-[acyl-carrier-protein] synthase-1